MIHECLYSNAAHIVQILIDYTPKYSVGKAFKAHGQQGIGELTGIGPRTLHL